MLSLSTWPSLKQETGYLVSGAAPKGSYFTDMKIYKAGTNPHSVSGDCDAHHLVLLLPHKPVTLWLRAKGFLKALVTLKDLLATNQLGYPNLLSSDVVSLKLHLNSLLQFRVAGKRYKHVWTWTEFPQINQLCLQLYKVSVNNIGLYSLVCLFLTEVPIPKNWTDNCLDLCE